MQSPIIDIGLFLFLVFSGIGVLLGGVGLMRWGGRPGCKG